MKKLHSTQILGLCLLFLIFFSSQTRASEIEDSTIQVTYLGATGYLIESINKKILIEPTFGDTVRSFGYPFPIEAVFDSLLYAKGSFDSIDLVLISHVHLGHFDTLKTLTLLDNHKQAKIITTQEVYDQLDVAAEDIASYDDQLCVPSIDNYEMFDTTISDIPFTITQIDHWGPTVLLQYSFTMDGIEIAFYLDYNQRIGEAHHVKTTGIDFGILDGDLFLVANERSMFTNDFEIGYSVFTHFTNFSSMENIIEENSADFPNVGFYYTPMAKYKYSFNSGVVTVDTLNHVPVVVNEIEDASFLVGEDITINLPDIIFEDADDEDLIIEITQKNGSELPDWLAINSELTTITGSTTQAQKVYIRIHATDPNNAHTTEDFTITIKDPASIENKQSEDRIEIYPNPANEELNIDLTEMDHEFKELFIYSHCGAILYHGQLESGRLNTINTEFLASGTYLIRLTGGDMKYSKTFVKL